MTKGVMTAALACASLLAIASPASGQAQTGSPPLQDAPAIAPDQAEADSGQAKAPDSGDIVVTARLGVQEQLTNVPIAISAVTGERLERLGIRSASEYLASVPSLGQFELSPGQTRIQIRGVVASYGEPTVGYYLDEIPFSNLIEPIVPDAGGFDLERIEVLRGPQGTLYGAGSSGGVVRILTAQPNVDRFEVKGDFSVSATRHADDPNLDVNGAVNVPLIPGKLALRVTGSYRSLSGVLNNPVLGRRNYDDQEYGVYRARLRAEPTSNLDITAGVWLQRLRNFTGDGSISPSLSRTSILEPQKVDYTIYSLIGNYHADGFTITSASSYLTYDTVRQRALASVIPFTYSFDSRLFTQEVRAVSDRDGPFAWAVGGFLRTGNTNNEVLLPAFGLDDHGRFESTAWAVFGEGTAFFADHRGEFTVGARYFRDRRSEGFNGLLIKNTFPAFSPKVNLTWHFNDNALVYLNFARGFRSGINQSSPVLAFAEAAGVTVPLSAPPESTWAYEAGLKAGLLDNKVNLELVGFVNKIRNIQSLVQLPQIPRLSAIVGGNRATVQGVEATVSLRPARGVSLSGSIGYNDGRYDTNAFNAFNVGDPITGASKWTASGTFDVERPLSGSLNGFANFFVSHFSPRFQPNLTPAVGLPAQAITNARARIGIRSGPLEASVFAENLFDEGGRIGPDFVADGRSQFLRPRTFGVDLRMQLQQER